MPDSLLDEIRRRASRLTAADLEPPDNGDHPAPGDLIAGELDLQHKQLWTVLMAVEREVEESAKLFEKLVKAGQTDRLSDFVKDFGHLKRKRDALNSLFYLSVRQKFSLEAAMVVYVTAQWQVCYEGPQKTAARMETAQRMVSEALAKSTARVGSGGNRGDGGMVN